MLCSNRRGATQAQNRIWAYHECEKPDLPAAAANRRYHSYGWEQIRALITDRANSRCRCCKKKRCEALLTDI